MHLGSFCLHILFLCLGRTLVNAVKSELQAIETSFILRQEWQDPRLVFGDFNHSLVLGHKKLASLWIPDLYFTQSQQEYLHMITTPNVMIRLHPDGTVLYTQRLSVILQCKMRLENFPMDSQKCSITMESYSFTAEEVAFSWSTRRRATSVKPAAITPDFNITKVYAEDCSSTYAIGTYTCLRAVLCLERQMGYYAHQSYIPSILIVVLSWASFWIDHEAVPARISVGLLTVLTITTQSWGARSQLPRVSYVKAIDLWMVACLIFVFSAYMEYAIVTILSRKYKKRSEARGSQKESSFASSASEISESTNDSEHTESRDGSGSAIDMSTGRDPGRILDKISRTFFPLLFMTFNLYYWLTYTIIVQ